METDPKMQSWLGRREFLTASSIAAAALTASPATAQSPGASWGEEDWGAAQHIPLWKGAPPSGGFQPQHVPADSPPFFLRNIERPFLRVFRPQKPNGRMLLSIPGGAYTFVSIANEGVAVAWKMVAQGYTVFVLAYRLPGEGWSDRENVPLQDAQRAIRLMRAFAAEYYCHPDQTYVVGFSAGGHLAATLCTGFSEAVYDPRDTADKLSARPRAAGLIYPVISQTEGIGHAESTLRLLGPNPGMASIYRRSPNLHVSEETPPVFLLHAMDDPAVPIENSLLMMGALSANRRPVEAHFFEKDGHGFGTGTAGQPHGAWPDLFAKWLDSHSG